MGGEQVRGVVDGVVRHEFERGESDIACRAARAAQDALRRGEAASRGQPADAGVGLLGDFRLTSSRSNRRKPPRCCARGRSTSPSRSPIPGSTSMTTSPLSTSGGTRCTSSNRLVRLAARSRRGAPPARGKRRACGRKNCEGSPMTGGSRAASAAAQGCSTCAPPSESSPTSASPVTTSSPYKLSWQRVSG